MAGLIIATVAHLLGTLMILLLRQSDSDNVMSAEEIFADIPEMASGAEATRVSGNKVIQEISMFVLHYVSGSGNFHGSTNLHGSTRNYINYSGNFGAGFNKTYTGKILYFGIREHGMGTIMNGFAYHRLFIISGSISLCLLITSILPSV